MPKKSAHPGFRTHVRKGANGQRWVSYWLDKRGTGQPDIPLGTDHAAALAKYQALRVEAPLIAGTLEEAFLKWEKEELPKYANETTRRNYKQSLSRMRPSMKSVRWRDVSEDMIMTYLENRTAKTQGNREMALLSIIWGKARRWKFVSTPFPVYKMKWKNKERPAQVEWSDEMFAAMYVHAEPFLRDAMDLTSATGWRVRDALKARLTDVRGDWLKFSANKNGKLGDFDLRDPEKQVIPVLLAKRRAMKEPEHIFVLARGRLPVTERMLTDAWARARKQAMKVCPAVEKTLMLRYVRKYAGQLAGSLAEAQALLQHGSAATTQRHYRPREKLRPVR